MSPQEALERIIETLAGREAAAVLVLAGHLAAGDRAVVDRAGTDDAPRSLKSERQARWRDRKRLRVDAAASTKRLQVDASEASTERLPVDAEASTSVYQASTSETPVALARPRAADLSSSSDLSFSAETKEDLRAGEEEGECEREKPSVYQAASTKRLQVDASEASTKKPRKTSKPRTAKELPPASDDPQSPTWLAEKGLPALSSEYGAEVAKMLDWHIANGERRNEWKASWRNWKSREGERGWRPGPAPGHATLKPLGDRSMPPMPEYDEDPAWLIEARKQPGYVAPTRETAMAAIEAAAKKTTVRFEGQDPFVFDRRRIDPHFQGPPSAAATDPPPIEPAPEPDPDDDFPPGY